MDTTPKLITYEGIIYLSIFIVGISFLFQSKMEWIGLYLSIMAFFFVTTFATFDFLLITKTDGTALMDYISIFIIWINVILSFINSIFILLLAVYLWNYFFKYGKYTKSMASSNLFQKWRTTKALWVSSVCIGIVCMRYFSNFPVLPNLINYIKTFLKFIRGETLLKYMTIFLKFIVGETLFNYMTIFLKAVVEQISQNITIMNGLIIGNLAISIITLYYAYTLYKARGGMRPHTKSSSTNKANIRPIRPYDELWGGATVSYLSKYIFT